MQAILKNVANGVVSDTASHAIEAMRSGLHHAFDDVSGSISIGLNSEFIVVVLIIRSTYRACAEDAQTDFLSDCIEIPQAYLRMSRNYCAR